MGERERGAGFVVGCNVLLLTEKPLLKWSSLKIYAIMGGNNTSNNSNNNNNNKHNYNGSNSSNHSSSLARHRQRAHRQAAVLALHCVYVTYFCLLFKCIYAGQQLPASQPASQLASIATATGRGTGLRTAFQQIVKSCLAHPRSACCRESVTEVFTCCLLVACGFFRYYKYLTKLFQ